MPLPLDLPSSAFGRRDRRVVFSVALVTLVRGYLCFS